MRRVDSLMMMIIEERRRDTTPDASRGLLHVVSFIPPYPMPFLINNASFLVLNTSFVITCCGDALEVKERGYIATFHQASSHSSSF
jgi:hypothetical protein